MEDGRSFPAAQVFDDIGQVSRVEMGEFLLRDTEMEQIGTRKELDVFPGDELVGKVIGEKPLESPIHRLLPSHPPHQPSKSHVHMDQPEAGIYSEEMEIVDPHYLCTEGIDDLFVHHLLLDENEVMRGKGGLRESKFVFGKNDAGFDLKDLFPREVELFSSPLRMDDHANDHGIGFCSLGHEIRDFTHFLAGGVKNASVYKVTKKIEFFEVLIHFLPD
jgi:hypothetical protein